MTRSNYTPCNELWVLCFWPIHQSSSWFLGHPSHSVDLLLWVGVHRLLTSSFQELLGQSLSNLICSICRVRRQEFINIYNRWPFRPVGLLFLGSMPLLNLKIWQKIKYLILKQFVSAAPKLLNRISWNSVVIKDILCRCEYLPKFLI